MERLLVSFNWVVGTLALVIGLGWPFINVKMVIPAIRSEAEGTIKLLANAEQELHESRRPFAVFVESALPDELAHRVSLPSGNRYDYEAFINEKGYLVLRAYVKPPEVLKGRVIPGVYEFVMDSGGAIADGRWLGLSGSQRSLF
ncbi:hypothetical protein CCP3SC1_1430001 [Gammaproteobacteria bacterium]